MSRRATICIAVVAAIAVVTFLLTRLNTRAPEPEKDEFDKILDALAVEFPVANTNTSSIPPFLEKAFDFLGFSEPKVDAFEARRLVVRKWLDDYKQAQEKLRQLGTNVLPRLKEEVRKAGIIESTNRLAARKANLRLSHAFEALKDGALPLLPFLIEELREGRSIGPAIYGIADIGGTHAGLALASQLTNSDSYTRNGLINALFRFGTNQEVAIVAVPLLLTNLHGTSVETRRLAAGTLGNFLIEPQIVIPTLLRIAETDPAIPVRISAIKAIGNHGTNAIMARARLESMAGVPDPALQRTLERVLETIDGKRSVDSLY